MKKFVGTIDCTPTWISLLPVMLDLVKQDKADKTIMDSFKQMAQVADICKTERDELDTAKETLKFIKGWLNNDEKVLADLADTMAGMGENCTHALAIKLLIGKIDQSL